MEDGIMGWTEDNRRVDRPDLAVREARNGWYVVEADQVVYVACPCCERPMKSAYAAKIVCDALYGPPAAPHGLAA
jgi:hypothetical protein